MLASVSALGSDASLEKEISTEKLTEEAVVRTSNGIHPSTLGMTNYIGGNSPTHHLTCVLPACSPAWRPALLVGL